jgi:DNA-binding MurR/RpiR family transcriptional regulator
MQNGLVEETADHPVGVSWDGPTTRAIRAALSDLVPSELKVAERFLADPRTVMYQSISEVALAAGTSASTVVRACRRLGFRGFQDLKLALAQEAIPPMRRLHDEIDESSTPGEVLAAVLGGGEEALHHVRDTLDDRAFERAVDLVASARHVMFAGVGTSAPLAQDAAYRFLTIGVDTDAPLDAHVQHVRARLLGTQDVCVAISHTGATQETLATLRGAAEGGASTLAVTSFVRSPLTELVDVALVAGSRELSYRVEAMSSRIAHLCVLDALFVAVAMRDPSRASSAQDATADVLSEHRF